MMRTRSNGLAKATAAAVAMVAAVLVPATAIAAKAKPVPSVALKVTVTNGRDMAISQIGFSLPGASQAGENLLKTPLAPGKSTVVTLKAKKGECLFDLAGRFDNDDEISGEGLNLCTDKTVTVVE